MFGPFTARGPPPAPPCAGTVRPIVPDEPPPPLLAFPTSVRAGNLGKFFHLGEYCERMGTEYG